MATTSTSTSSINDNECEKSVVEFSFATFWNWFLPSCMDIRSSTSLSSKNGKEIMIAYGAKSFLFLANVLYFNNNDNNYNNKTNKKTTKKWNLCYKDIVNVFDIKSKSDVFRSNNCYITTVVFDNTISMIKQQNGSNIKNNNDNDNLDNYAMIFVGNSDGIGALYDYQHRITLLQNLPFSAISRSCCKIATQKKILSACWLHFENEGPVVYYSCDKHIIAWKVKKNEAKILHDMEENCNNCRFNREQSQISSLASLPAECTFECEHKLAIGFMGGKIVLIGFDMKTGKQTDSLRIFSEKNGHSDDICSLSFASYSLSSQRSFRQGLLCSVSRDSVLKIWSCSDECEIAEHRIISSTGGGGVNKNTTSSNNWFTARFMPKSCLLNNQQQQKQIAYEIIFTNSSGDLLTFTISDKPINSKLRIGKVQRTFQQSSKSMINHTFIIFSMAIDLENKLAITNSLDHKLILWNLSKRQSEHVLYSFSNGAIAIDCCPTDKRLAIAFGSSVFVLDFIHCNDDFKFYDVHIDRLSQLSSSTKTKFFNIIWNRQYYERLGRLIIATIDGDLIHYDLNGKEVLFKMTNNNNNKRDTTKIYSIIWLDKLLSSDEKSTSVVLTLHQSGKILVNHLNSNFQQENFDKYLAGIPDNHKVKPTAITTNDDTSRLFIGNDDGTVDVYDRMESDHVAYQHRYRFRSFNCPCLSIDYCSQTNHLAITSLHENYINCYEINIDNQESSHNDNKLIVNNQSIKCRLQGHTDRVSYTCFSPFNNNQNEVLLASASYDTTCIIWNINNHNGVKRFSAHHSLIYCIKWCHFHSDYIFTAGEDNFFIWNWRKQPDYDRKYNTKVNINTLNDIVDHDDDDDCIDKINIDIDKLQIKSSASSSDNKSSKTSPTAISIKSLFSLNNQIENNSTKHQHLDDINRLIQYKSNNSINDQSKNLDRILLYCNRYEYIERLLMIEIENHEKNNNHEAHYILSLFLNATSFIEQQLSKQNECDPILALIASNISPKLYEQCIRMMIGDTTTNGKHQFNCKIKWTNYAKELSALIRILCLNEFNAAIDSLLEQNLYRESIILSIIHLASDAFINRLMYRWHEYRLKQQNNYEGAIKCLISGEYYAEARDLLKQRRILCSETSTNSILSFYDEIIREMDKLI